MPLINVDESLNRLLTATDTLESVLTPLTKVGQAQVLAQDVIAELTEPPFRSSAMDGFAKIGRASCRERVEMSGGGGSLKKKKRGGESGRRTGRWGESA